MTEAEWLTCTDPNPMLRFLKFGRKGTCRKLRLFGVACCRRIWRFLDDEQIRQVVEVAEGYADGLTSAAELQATHLRSSTLCKQLDVTPDSPRMACILSNAAVAANWVSASDAYFRTNDPGGYSVAAAGYIAGSAADAAFYATYEGADAMELLRQRSLEGASTPADSIWAAEEEAQSGLLRCVFGNPFCPISLYSAWLRWNDGTVPKVAQRIYDECEFRLMPILADALEDAGCDNEAILRHCRELGEHVRGCWVIDLLLGKE